jgi:hypothetical protein
MHHGCLFEENSWPCDGKDNGCRIVRKRIKSGQGTTQQGSSTKDHFPFRSLLHNVEVTSLRDALRLSSIRESMGAIGDSYDNAMAESLWASLKNELIYRTTFSTREVTRTFSTRQVTRAAIFDWYNKTRRGSGISRRFSVRERG